MLLEFLFMHYNMNMVYLKVAGFNPYAKKLYEKVGLKKQDICHYIITAMENIGIISLCP